MQLNTIELIQKLKEASPLGYEVSLRMGILATTKDVFYKRKRFYLFSSDEFESIYDVPLDGSYIFSIFDSGQRGLGSFNYIRVTKTENEIIVPYVNPGAFPPITINK